MRFQVCGADIDFVCFVMLFNRSVDPKSSCVLSNSDMLLVYSQSWVNSTFMTPSLNKVITNVNQLDICVTVHHFSTTM